MFIDRLLLLAYAIILAIQIMRAYLRTLKMGVRPSVVPSASFAVASRFSFM